MEINVMQSVYARNEVLARELNARLTKNRVFAVNVMGAPGVGKTSSLIRIIEALKVCGDDSFVIEGDIQSDIDTQRLAALGIRAAQINTGGACHLDAPFVAKAYDQAGFTGGFLFIENIGNLVCPAEFMIGEHVKLLITAVTEGADKPYKYPPAFEKAGAIILNKTDLSEHVDFDREYYMDGIRKLNREAPIFEVSCKTGGNFGEVAQWLKLERAKFING